MEENGTNNRDGDISCCYRKGGFDLRICSGWSSWKIYMPRNI